MNYKSPILLVFLSMKLIILLALLSFISPTLLSAQVQPSEGQWQGVLEYEQEGIPFEFIIEYQKNDLTITIINGKE
ncbi:MAG: hypothetical protein RLO81_02695, partial [Fulvivirga sp.]